MFLHFYHNRGIESRYPSFVLLSLNMRTAPKSTKSSWSGFLVFIIFLLVPATSGESCIVYTAGVISATYCEKGCCKNACCDHASPYTDSSASTVLGAVSAALLAFVLVFIIVCCCRHQWQQYDKQDISISISEVSHAEPSLKKYPEPCDV